MLTPAIFQELGIETKEFYMSQPDAIQKIKAGELDATVCMCPTPVPAFATMKADANLGLIDVSYPEKLQKSYLPATISHDDYPNLLPKGAKVDTVASTTVLITFNWPKGSIRYNRTAKFVDAFFTKFADLQKPPRHPLWKSVNYAANLPAWQRFPAAQEWLDQHRPTPGAGAAETDAQRRASAGAAKANAAGAIAAADRDDGSELQPVHQGTRGQETCQHRPIPVRTSNCSRNSWIG